jgi:hypothetical protein
MTWLMMPVPPTATAVSLPPPHRATTPDLWTHAQAVGMKDFPGFNLGSYLTDFIPFVNSTENHRFEEPFGDRFGCGVLAPHDGSFPL